MPVTSDLAHRVTRASAALLLAGALPLGACGGGGGGGGSDAPRQATLLGIPSMDGLLRNGFALPAQELIIGNFVVLGPPLEAFEMRSMSTFDLTPLPAGADVVSAVVTLTQFSVTGTTYVGRAPAILDHVNIGTSLSGDDFNGGTLASNIGVLSADATLGPKSLDVTAQVAADIAAGRTRSSFRLRFQNVLADLTTGRFAQFGDAEGTRGSTPPTLVVTFTE